MSRDDEEISDDDEGRALEAKITGYMKLGVPALTLLVAFDAGARTERPEENGMAHFLEHLVFKGGEKYPTYRDVNEAAEGIGAVLNAYTSHDLVAFHITARAQRALEAADLLTDFVGRPRIDAGEMDRERGVVVQEIARSDDQPSVQAEHLIDEAVEQFRPRVRALLSVFERVEPREGLAPERVQAQVELEQHVLLALEVVIERRLRRAQPLGDVTQRGLVVTLLGEQLERDVEDALACRGAALCGCGSRGRGALAGIALGR